MSDERILAIKRARIKEAQMKEASMQEAQKNKQSITGFESGLAGASQGALLGFPDEIYGGVRGAYDALTTDQSLSDAYKQRRDESRRYYETARQANPMSYGAGEVTGAVGSAFIPGLNVAKGASLATKAGMAAGLGGAAGYGMSNEEKIGDQLKDAATGAALAGGLTGAIGKAAPLIPNAVKKGANVVLGLPEKAFERYVARPDAIKAAQALRGEDYGLPKLAEKLTSRVDELADDAVSGSVAARNTLKFEGTKVPVSNVRDKIQQALAEIAEDERGIPNDAYAAAKQSLSGQLKKLDEFGQPDMDLTQIMDRVREMRQATSYNPATGAIDSKSGRILKGTAKNLDEYVKEQSPAYRTIMGDAAEDAKMLERIKPLAGRDESGSLRMLNAINQERNKFKLDDLRAFDPELADEALDAITARGMDRQITQGSRNVNLFRDTFGQALQDQNIPFGKALGAGVGASIDKYGPRMAQTGIDALAGAQRMGNKFGQAFPGVQSALGKTTTGYPLAAPMISSENPETLSTITTGQRQSLASSTLADKVKQNIQNPALAPFAARLNAAAKKGDGAVNQEIMDIAQEYPEILNLVQGGK